jgi:hypothetical protein
MARYSDEDKAIWLLQLEAAGYPKNEHAPMRVAKQKNAPHARTLKRWWKRKHEPHIDKIVQRKRPDLIKAIEDLLWQHIEAATEAVQGSEDLRAIDTGIGILADKLQLMRGEPTERHDQRILIERTGISTIPEHLTRGAVAGSEKLDPLQRPKLRA